MVPVYLDSPALFAAVDNCPSVAIDSELPGKKEGYHGRGTY